ncbi:hypothetical protein AZE42_04290 [Rhizopogon vesiculosus]|uniref:Uncharacterized protein n=1 Tax=Rhizopogon vesiculosus TaxID=180088 RepID=A0A1J8Q352_9AGAM|nr:hypothetical protein AZE42_04290 [Rhizopogon vesiculosus]
MTGWQSIIFDDDSTSVHPMHSLAIQVMQCIYRTVDPTHPPPSNADGWWNSPSLYYQVDQSGYDTSIVILNLREGMQYPPQMHTHFMINLNTMCVHDKFQDIRFPVPGEICSVAAQLKEYVTALVRERKEAEEALQREEALRLQKTRLEEHQKRVQAFYRCLIEKGLLDEDDAKQLSSDGVDCPLCSAQQESCRACGIISCSSSDCKASSAIPIMKCCTHSSKNYCTSCLESPPAADVLPLMGQCPICAHWFCSEELRWCIGRPVLNEGTSVIEPLSPSTTGDTSVAQWPVIGPGDNAATLVVGLLRARSKH